MLLEIVERFIKGLAAAVIYPVATIISAPKMIRIYFDPDVQTRHITQKDVKPDCNSCCEGRHPEFYRRPPDEVIIRMKQLVPARYKISISYLRSQVRIHLTSAYITAICIPIYLVVTIASPFWKPDPNNPNNQEPPPSQGVMFTYYGIIMSLIPSLYGLLRTILGFGNQTYFISALDEITYPFKRLCTKKPSRQMDRLIANRSVDAFTKEGLDIRLSRTILPTLNKDLNKQKNKIKLVKEYLNTKVFFPNTTNEIIVDYAFSNSLIFSAGNVINTRKLKALDQMCQPKFESPEEELDIIIENDLKITIANANGAGNNDVVINIGNDIKHST